MSPAEILARLKTLAGSAPDFSTYTSTSHEHQQWLGETQTLIAMVDKYEALSFGTATSSLTSTFFRDNSVNTLMTTLYRIISQLEAASPPAAQQVFGPGATYDFMKELRKLLASANTAVLIVDPYLDDEIFDTYLSLIPASVQVTILTSTFPASLKSSLAKFNSQHGRTVEIRRSRALHDRLVFVDNSACWFIGQSIKDAATAKPTYIAPLSQEFVTDKLAAYAQIWQGSQPLI
jgi:hypothetical protein